MLKIKPAIRSYLILFAGTLLSIGPTKSERFCFRIYLNDKGASGYTIDNPVEFLSQEAIDRRNKEGIPVDESDLPVARSCLDTLASLGARPVVISKWLSTVVVECEDSTTAHKLQSLAIVDSVRLVWKGEQRIPSPAKTGVKERDTSRLIPVDKPLKSPYGYAEAQIKMLNGIRFHEKGYRGKGMKVAVIDAGFINVDRMTVFQSLDLAGTHNVVYPGESVFHDDDHGTKVLSCLAANAPGVMIGTAPEASYWLIKSEDNNSEYPIEEDYWTAAVEFADSAGVTVISSSLGYFTFDEKELNYQPSMLDGRTTLISQAADKAADKGILLFVSAGNEGNGSWEKLTFPSDAIHVITVGSVTQSRERSVFSSIGPAADLRVKPDIVALGTNCAVTDGSGSIRYANGTSFSTPIAAGLGICLWQAFPQLNNMEIARLIQRSSSQYDRPDDQLGYGIPDIYKAFKTKH
jgi:subtilisin family serine protease